MKKLIIFTFFSLNLFGAQFYSHPETQRQSFLSACGRNPNAKEFVPPSQVSQIQIDYHFTTTNHLPMMQQPVFTLRPFNSHQRYVNVQPITPMDPLRALISALTQQEATARSVILENFMRLLATQKENERQSRQATICELHLRAIENAKQAALQAETRRLAKQAKMIQDHFASLLIDFAKKEEKQRLPITTSEMQGREALLASFLQTKKDIEKQEEYDYEESLNEPPYWWINYKVR